MPIDWVNKNPANLAVQIDTFTAALNTPGGLAASGLTAGDFTTLTTLNTSLKAATLAKVAAEGAYRQAVDAENAAMASASNQLRMMGRNANNQITMTDALRNAATLTVKDTEPSPRLIPIIDDLSVVGLPNGNNTLKWSVPPGSTGCIYEIEFSMGSSGSWTVAGATSKRNYLHEGAGAGVHRLYRIVARRGNLRGQPGNEASVYGI